MGRVLNIAPIYEREGVCVGTGEGWGGSDVNTMITAVQVLPTLYCRRPTASEIEIKVESQSTLLVRVVKVT